MRSSTSIRFLVILSGFFSLPALGAPGGPLPLLPTVDGSVASPDRPGFYDPIFKIRMPGMSLIRPGWTAARQEDVPKLQADLQALAHATNERFRVALRAKDLPRFEPIDSRVKAEDVIGGQNMPARDALITNEMVMMGYFKFWFTVFARSGDRVATPTDPARQLHLLFGFAYGDASGTGAALLPFPNSDTEFQIVRGIVPFSANTAPNTLDYIEEYAIISHELGHLFLRLHNQNRPAAPGMADKAEELRADCISGYMLGTLFPGFINPRRERVEKTFARVGTFEGGAYSHGTWKERGDSARLAFIHGGNTVDKAGKFSVTTADLVNYCVSAHPNP